MSRNSPHGSSKTVISISHMLRNDDSAQQRASRPRLPAWRRWTQLSRAEQATSIEAFITMAAVRVLMTVSPASFTAKKIQRIMGKDTLSPARVDDSATLEVIEIVRDAIVRASLRVPRATCLIQAVSGWYLLHRRGIEATVRIGVQKDEQAFSAHAWLRVGDSIVIGGDDADLRFVTLAARRATDR